MTVNCLLPTDSFSMKPTIALVAALLLIGLAAAEAADKSRPNILFIIADDQSPMDFGFYNPQASLRTPVLDNLAAQGMVIDGA